MAEPTSNSRTAILVAIIGVLGVLGSALIANWEKIFPSSRGRESAAVSPREANVVLLGAPVPVEPKCGEVIAAPKDDNLLSLRWSKVEKASTYSVEVDCFGCGGRQWFSASGVPWHVRDGLGLRIPLYSSSIYKELRKEGGSALRWRVWGVDQDGKPGRKSDWCQIAFTGGQAAVRP
ncbi:hypothetical protein QTH90_30785 [Variovorax sp. J2P1-59]|uniref:hypothetical protein n=1 Tax=Variovorax flavidus TaxID=3053501 RepID=UPI0025771282|nr:hypothetical protein [Variovorax sp. J2P1-59]MDM0078828.1 hypothetical protein [Variovorax sp. J2P1-59]